MAGDDLLENASCLMPREWPFHGGEDVAVPRSEGLSSGEGSSSGIDAARILACAEAVRHILAFQQQPSAASANVEPGAPAIAEAPVPSASAPSASVPSTPAPSAPVATDSGIDALSRASAPATDDAVERPSAEKAPAGLESRSLPSAAKRSADAPREAGADVRPSADAPVFQPGRTEASRTDRRDTGKIGGDAKRGGFEIGANPGAGSTAETNSFHALGSKPQEARETASPVSTQGVKAGSMASEFIGRQVVEKVDVQLRQGRRELNVRLWPEELGEVRLSLRIGEADKLDARIMVQTESVRQAILDATPQLRDALARHGMEMGRLSVNIDSGMASGEGSSRGDGRGERQDGGNPRWRGSWQDEEVEYGAALALGVDSGYRDGRNTLDMWS